MSTHRLGVASMVLTLSVALCPTPAQAQQAATHAQKPTTGTGEVTLTATSANVSEPGSQVKIRILRWSTDEERTPLLAALNPPAPVAAPARAAAGRPTGAGPSAAPGAPAGDAPNPSAAPGLPTEAGPNPSAAPGLPTEAAANPSAAAGGAARAGRAGAGRAGRAGAGRAGRGAARGGRGDATPPPNPIAVLTAAIGRAPTLGYIWTSDITGYAIKYAYRASLPDGGERIILATDRRLGAHTPAWKPVATTLTDYEFTLIEIRLDAKGMGEAKTSLTTKVIVDEAAKTVALDGYATTSAVLQHVKR